MGWTWWWAAADGGLDVTADLRATTREAFREDAPPASATAREHLLQLLRARYLRGSFRLSHCGGWSPDDIADLEWLCGLADAGHCGASGLRDAVMALDRPVPTHAWIVTTDPPSAAPAPLRDLASRTPTVALGFAILGLSQAAPQPAVVAPYLQAAGESFAELAAILRDSFAGVESLPRDDADAVRKQFNRIRGMATPGDRLINALDDLGLEF